ncbi:putative phage tail protein [Vibrio phage 150E35-1]|nr:putative phage tail protein [Vibrio phage 150E35-1]
MTKPISSFFATQRMGELPTVQPTQLGDGTNVEFDAPSFPKVLPPNAYEVTIDGFQQTPVDSYVTDTVNKVKFNSPVPKGAKVSIQLRNIQEVAPYGDATNLTIIPEGDTESGRRSLPGAIAESIDMLVGFVLPDSTMQVSPDRAFLADGSEYRRSDYPKLWSKVNGTAMLVSQALINADPETYAANYGDGNGATTFTLPNYGLRPHLAAAGAFGDVGGTIEDRIQNITGRVGVSSALAVAPSPDGAFTSLPSSDFRSNSDLINNTLDVFFDASLVVRTGEYTEVNSSFLNFYIIHGESA